MIMTSEFKRTIYQEITNDFQRKQKKDDSYSQSRYSTHLGIDPAQMSRILKGDTDRVISDEKLIRIAVKLNLDLSGQNWKTARTTTLNTMLPQMEYCQEKGISRFFIDLIGIGKTHTAKEFVKHTVNAVYINCKLYQTKQPLIRAIAREFGYKHSGRYIAVREELLDNIRTLRNPIIIIDDTGYLKDEAILELIALWDELIYSCGFYFIAEPSFALRLNKMIDKNKLGWEAWNNRNAERILSVTGELSGDGEKALMKRVQAEQILSVNMPGLNKKQVSEVLTGCSSNLRTLREDIAKMKTPE